MSETNKNIVFVCSIVSLGMSTFLLGTYLYGIPISGLTWLATLPFGLGLGTYLIARYTDRQETKAVVDDYSLYGNSTSIVVGAMTKPGGKKPDPGRMFCADCGKKYVMRESQRGFDQATGKPKYTYQLGCPDGDPNKMTRSGAAGMKMGILGYSGPSYCWPDCDNPTFVPLKPVKHNHATVGVSAECPKCIEQMMIDGAIDRSGVEKLLAAIGELK